MTIKLNQYTLTTEEQLNSKKNPFERNEIVSKHTSVDETMYICLLLTETCLRNCRCWVELSKRFIFSSPRSLLFCVFFPFFASLYLLLFHMSNFFPKKSKTVRESLLIYNAVVVSFNFDSGFCCLNCGRTIVILSIVSIE